MITTFWCMYPLFSLSTTFLSISSLLSFNSSWSLINLRRILLPNIVFLCFLCYYQFVALVSAFVDHRNCCLRANFSGNWNPVLHVEVFYLIQFVMMKDWCFYKAFDISCYALALFLTFCCSFLCGSGHRYQIVWTAERRSSRRWSAGAVFNLAGNATSIWKEFVTFLYIRPWELSLTFHESGAILFKCTVLTFIWW